MRFLAYSLSVLLHPVLIPTLTVFLLVRVDPVFSGLINENALWKMLMAIAITTGVLPALSVYILSKAELVESIELKERRERIVPFIMSLFYLMATYIFLMKAPLPGLIYSAMLGIIAAFAGLTIMSFFWRISVHLCAYGSMVGALSGLFAHDPFPFKELLVLLVLLGGILASARIYLGAHSLSELAAGAAWGFFCSFFFVSEKLFIPPSLLYG